jgi:hypothetical protein
MLYSNSYYIGFQWMLSAIHQRKYSDLDALLSVMERRLLQIRGTVEVPLEPNLCLIALFRAANCSLPLDVIEELIRLATSLRLF